MFRRKYGTSPIPPPKAYQTRMDSVSAVVRAERTAANANVRLLGRLRVDGHSVKRVGARGRRGGGGGGHRYVFAGTWL